MLWHVVCVVPHEDLDHFVEWCNKILFMQLIHQFLCCESRWERTLRGWSLPPSSTSKLNKGKTLTCNNNLWFCLNLFPLQSNVCYFKKLSCAVSHHRSQQEEVIVLIGPHKSYKVTPGHIHAGTDLQGLSICFIFSEEVRAERCQGGAVNELIVWFDLDSCVPYVKHKWVIIPWHLCSLEFAFRFWDINLGRMSEKKKHIYVTNSKMMQSLLYSFST